MNCLWPSLDLVLADRAEDGPWQMAADEALLNQRTRPVLRAYLWKKRQITFGFFGDLEQMRGAFPDLLLTRRWTGGGAVEHGEDLTFGLVWPRAAGGGRELPDRADAIYARLHEILRRSLRVFAQETEFAQSTEASTTGAFCFQAPVSHDLLQGHSKVAGGALRRTRTAWLYQGSVLLPQARPDPGSFFRELARQLAEHVEEGTLTAREEETARGLVAEKYASTAWLEGGFLRRMAFSSPTRSDGD